VAIKPTAPAIDHVTLREFFHTLQPHADMLHQGNGGLNLWGIAGLGRDEVRNAAVLCWVLSRLLLAVPQMFCSHPPVDLGGSGRIRGAGCASLLRPLLRPSGPGIGVGRIR